MNTMLITTAILLLGSPAVFLAGARIMDTEWDVVGFFACLSAVCMVLGGILIPAITYGGRAYGRVECRNWGHQTNRPTKFVVYTSWSTGECLTRNDNGKWISKDMLREFGSGR